jgi:hypothetical protein
MTSPFEVPMPFQGGSNLSLDRHTPFFVLATDYKEILDPLYWVVTEA